MTGAAAWIRTYERDNDYIESLGGVGWADAPLPSRWHHCQTQTRGWFGFNYVERCACGATRLSSHDPWMEKNQTRKSRARQERDDKAPKETITCQICGQLYEAVAGSRMARERLCSSCWCDQLVRAHGYPDYNPRAVS